MSYELRQEPGLTVLGIAARVSNAEPQRIGDLWQSLHAMGNAQAIPGRLDDSLYSVYCEYEGDYTQPYTVVIGCAVSQAAAVPKGMRTISVPGGQFAVLRPEGELPQAVFDTWAWVWGSSLERRYEADYDRYGADGAVTVHVGVK